MEQSLHALLQRAWPAVEQKAAQQYLYAQQETLPAVGLKAASQSLRDP
ncbi:MAG: hypothetical protein ABSG38_05860 [Spirochaetia bacterium]|jgi:hypothetical protein